MPSHKSLVSKSVPKPTGYHTARRKIGKNASPAKSKRGDAFKKGVSREDVRIKPTFPNNSVASSRKPTGVAPA